MPAAKSKDQVRSNGPRTESRALLGRRPSFSCLQPVRRLGSLRQSTYKLRLQTLQQTISSPALFILLLDIIVRRAPRLSAYMGH